MANPQNVKVPQEILSRHPVWPINFTQQHISINFKRSFKLYNCIPYRQYFDHFGDGVGKGIWL